MKKPQLRLKTIRRILDEVEVIRADADRKKLNFTAVDEDALIRKFARANSPMIIFQSWTGSAMPGGMINYTFGVFNPDPSNWIWMYGYGYVGPANFVHDVGLAVGARDRRFAELTKPSFPGQQVASLATVTMGFSMPVPMSIEKTTYQGNTMLFQADWHDVGQYIDRGLWTFDVT